MDLFSEFRASDIQDKQKIQYCLTVIDQSLDEQKLLKTSNNYFVTFISLLLSEKATLETRGYLCYLISFILQDLPELYLSQNFELLFPLYITIIKADGTFEPVRQKLFEGLPLLLKSRLKCANSIDTSFTDGFIILMELCSSENPSARSAAINSLKALIYTSSVISKTASLQMSYSVSVYVKLSLNTITKDQQHSRVFLSCLKALHVCLLEEHVYELLVLVFDKNIEAKSQKELKRAYYECLQLLLKAHILNEVFQKLALEKLFEDKISQQEPVISSHWATVVCYIIRHSPSEDIKETTLVEVFKVIQENFSSSNSKMIDTGCRMFASLLKGLESADVSFSLLLRPHLIRFINDIFHWKFRAAFLQLLSCAIILLDYLKHLSLPFLQPFLLEVEKLVTTHDHKEILKLATDIISKFISHCGPEAVLNILPLNLSQENRRDWLIPLLKKHVHHSYLRFYVERLLSIAEKLQNSAQEILDVNRENGQAAIFTIYYYQIWGLLPSFIHHCVDFESVFPQIVPIFTSALKDAELCPIIAHSLDIAIEDFSEMYIDTLKRVSNEFLAEFFTLYQNTAIDKRNYILDVMKSLFKITDPSLILSYFTNVVKKLLQLSKEENSSSALISLMDILISTIPFLNEDSLKSTFKILLHFYSHSETAIKKKCSKGFSLLFLHEKWTVDHEDELKDLKKMVQLSLENPQNFKGFYKSLYSLMSSIPPQFGNIVLPILPHIILGTKEVNEAVRKVCFGIWDILGKRFIEYKFQFELPRSNSQEQYPIEVLFQMIMAGLAGHSCHMIASTMTTLAYLLSKFHRDISSTLFSQIADLVIHLKGQFSQQEWIKSYVELIKSVLLSIEHRSIVEGKLGALLSNLLCSSVTQSGTFKLKIRHIIERCLHHYGESALEASIPDEHQRLLINIKKSLRNKQKKEDKVLTVRSSITTTQKPINTATTFVNKGQVLVSSEPVDLLHTSMNTLFKSVGLANNENEKEFEKKDGRYIFVDSEDELDQGEDLVPIIQEEAEDKKISHKRAFESDEEEEEQRQPGRKDNQGIKKRKRNNEASPALLLSKYSGSPFKSRKSKGDVKAAGSQFEPFAYVPLSRKLLAANRVKSKKRQLYHK